MVIIVYVLINMKLSAFVQSVIIIIVIVVSAAALAWKYPNGHSFMTLSQQSTWQGNRQPARAPATNNAPFPLSSTDGTMKRSNDLISPVVERDYGSKIVYKSSSESKQENYQKDCTQRGGTFNACGSPCDPKATVCIQVCAYTCEFR